MTSVSETTTENVDLNACTTAPGGNCCCFLGDVGDSGVIGCALLEEGGLPGRLLGVSSVHLGPSSNFLPSATKGQALELQLHTRYSHNNSFKHPHLFFT